MTAVIRRSLVQGLCGVAVVTALSVAAATQEPVELTMIGHEATTSASPSHHGSTAEPAAQLAHLLERQVR